eukprot:645302-Hanusia_phi.AAC.1
MKPWSTIAAERWDRGKQTCDLRTHRASMPKASVPTGSPPRKSPIVTADRKVNELRGEPTTE